MGKHFKLYTDAQALASVLGNLVGTKKNSIMAGWLADLGENSFEIHQKAGKGNVLPDLAIGQRTRNHVERRGSAVNVPERMERGRDQATA